MKLLPDDRIVPSLMFHSVGLDRTDWVWKDDLSEPLAIFEDKLRCFSRDGFSAVFWGDVYKHVSGKSPLRGRSVMLTFDDGYLDNWVLVWPLLKRYQMRATIFVTTDFIPPDGPPRPTLEDIWSGRLRQDELEVAGFLRPSEMRLMVESGLVDIQSHASTHTWRFTDNKVIDVYTEDKYSRYPWLAWNARPDRKPFYLNENQASFVPEGEPIFANKDAIPARVFTPDPGAVADFRNAWSNAMREDTKRTEGISGERLAAILRAGKWVEGFPGSFETEEAREERIAQELVRSRESLVTLLGKPVEFISWPRGKYDDLAIRVASRLGFRSRTLGSRDQPRKKNRTGADPATLRRISTENHLYVRGVDCGMRSGYYQLLRMKVHQGSLAHAVWQAVYKFSAYVRALVFGAPT